MISPGGDQKIMHTKFRLKYLIGGVAIAVMVAGTACKQNVSSPEGGQQASQQTPVLPAAPGTSAIPGSFPTQAGGVAWTVPAGWEAGPEHQMRIATYRIHAIAGDPEDAECAVYFFGTGQGGTVEANLDRWKGQFTGPDGQSPVPAEINKRVINGLKVSTLAVSGTYGGAGGMMGQAPSPKPHYRMQAAIIEAPQGLVFFKLAGPLNTVAAAENDFNALLGSVHAQ
jgi:hypothetical protein